MDALSSQASIAGYKAVLLASNLLGKFFPMLTTAAGTIRPSKVLVIGAGVAGLMAISAALHRIYATAPDGQYQVYALSLSHPALLSDIHLTNNPVGFQGALDALVYVTFAEEEHGDGACSASARAASNERDRQKTYLAPSRRR